MPNGLILFKASTQEGAEVQRLCAALLGPADRNSRQGGDFTQLRHAVLQTWPDVPMRFIIFMRSHESQVSFFPTGVLQDITSKLRAH